jgi:hypothetical protein
MIRLFVMKRPPEETPTDDLTDEEWKIVEERAARRDLACEDEVEALFSRYRRA